MCDMQRQPVAEGGYLWVDIYFTRKERIIMLRLRPYKPCDAKYIVDWIIDEKQFFQWSADRIGEYPLTAERLNAHYDEAKDSDRFWQMTAIDDAGVPVGHFIMRYTDESLDNIRLGFIILDSRIRGKGYGKQMVMLAKKYAFEILGAKDVSLGVFANNSAAYHCYEAAGFTELSENSRNFYNINGVEWECIELHACAK